MPADEPVRGTFEEQPPTERTRRLAGGRGHEPVEVEPRDVRPPGQFLRGQRRVVQRVREQVQEPDEVVVGGHDHDPVGDRAART